MKLSQILFSVCLCSICFYIIPMSNGQEAASPQTEETPSAQKGPSEQAVQGDTPRRGRQGRRGGRGFGRRGGRSATPDDTTGFVQIFNGKDLENWDGDPKFWRVENGMIVGQSTAENRVQYNTFLIWRGGALKDFELKLEVRLTGGNSGIQYRSRENEQRGKWSVGGYQADFDANNRFSGMLYGEQGGGFLAPRGSFIRRTSNGQRLIASLGSAEDLANVYKSDQFNQFHIVAKGNTLLHFVNGRQVAGLIDEDENGGAYASEGILALQMHTGPPMKLEVRKIWYKKL